MDHEALHRRAREHGVVPPLYWLVRVTFQTFFWVYFRFERIGREHIPARGPVILASNHRSFLDPFVIACMARRPMYYVAKREIFQLHPIVAWLLNGLGAFPVARGAGDGDMIETAKAILARGDIVLIFPEGTRTRPGALGRPRRGVGRLALETGVPVVPVAVIGTEAVRRGWRIRPHKVRIRAGRALRFPRATHASPALAGAVTERIWPCVMLQWEWLGGLAPMRRAAVIGAGAAGTALAVALARAGLEVDLGCRTEEQATALAAEGAGGQATARAAHRIDESATAPAGHRIDESATARAAHRTDDSATATAARVGDPHSPGLKLPPTVRPQRAADLRLRDHDLVCLAVPANALPAVMAAHGEHITERAGVLVLSTGLVPPLASLQSVFVQQRSRARAVAVLGGPARSEEELTPGASVVIGCQERGFARQLAEALGEAGVDVSVTSDVTGVEMGGCGRVAAGLAAAAASAAGPGVAGAAAGKILAEVDALARTRGARSQTLVGMAGIGELVGSLLDRHSGTRQAGELLAAGVPASEIVPRLGRGADAVDAVPLLAAAAQEARVDAPALDSLAALVEGRLQPDRWTVSITEPARRRRRSTAAA